MTAKLNVVLSAIDRGLSGTLDRTNRKLGGLSGFARTAGASLLKLAAAFGVVAGAAGLARAAMGVVTSGARLEATLSRVGAVAEATDAQMAALEKTASELGRTTQFTAVQSADAMRLLVRSGFSVGETITAMPEVLNLAAAGAIEISEAADIAAQVMRGMGLEATDLGGAVDLMTKAFTSSNQGIEDVGAAMKFAGPIAKAAGKDLGEVVAAISAMADAGLRGEIGGTSIRRILLSMAKPSEQAKATLDRLGITFTDFAGDLRPIADVVEEFNQKLGDLGSGEKLAILGELFGARGATGFAALLEQGADRLRELEGAMNGAVGTAARIAARNIDNLSGKFTIFKSATESVKNALFALFGARLATLIEGATVLMNKLGAAITALQPQVDEFFSGLAKIQEELGNTADKIVPAWLNVGLVLTSVKNVFNGLALLLGSLAQLAIKLAGKVAIAVKTILKPFGDSGRIEAFFARMDEKSAAMVARLKANFAEAFDDPGQAKPLLDPPEDGPDLVDTILPPAQAIAARAQEIAKRFAAPFLGVGKVIGEQLEKGIDGFNKGVEKSIARAKQLTEQTRSPIEQFEAARDEARRLLAAGLIDAETATEVISQALEDAEAALGLDASGSSRASAPAALEKGSQEAAAAIARFENGVDDDTGRSQLDALLRIERVERESQRLIADQAKVRPALF